MAAINEVNASTYSGELTAAIAALGGNPGRVILDQTPCTQIAPVSVPANTRIIGPGQYLCEVVFPSGDGFTIAGDRCEVSGFSCKGTGGAGTGLQFATGSTEAHIHDLWMPFWNDAIRAQNCWSNYFERLTINNVTNRGIYILGGVNTSSFRDISIGLCETGIQLDGLNNGPFFYNTRIEAVTTGFLDYDLGTSYDLLYEGLYLENITGVCIKSSSTGAVFRHGHVNGYSTTYPGYLPDVIQLYGASQRLEHLRVRNGNYGVAWFKGSTNDSRQLRPKYDSMYFADINIAPYRQERV